MSVTLPFKRYCPFLLDSDIISLSSWMQIDKGTILDTTVDAHHTMHSSGVILSQHVQDGVSVGRLFSIARAYDLADSQVTDFIGFLNIVGGLRRQRKTSNILKASAIYLSNLFTGLRYAQLSRRSDASILQISFGVARATSYLFLTTTLVGFLFLCAGISLHFVMTTVSLGTVVFAVSITIHEWTHVQLIRRYGVKANILQRGLRLRVIHSKLTPKQEIIVALSGPLAGILFCNLLSFVVMLFGPRYFALQVTAISAFHLLALLPWYGDGASINQALQDRKIK